MAALLRSVMLPALSALVFLILRAGSAEAAGTADVHRFDEFPAGTSIANLYEPYYYAPGSVWGPYEASTVCTTDDLRPATSDPCRLGSSRGRISISVGSRIVRGFE